MKVTAKTTFFLRLFRIYNNFSVLFELVRLFLAQIQNDLNFLEFLNALLNLTSLASS